MTKKLYLWIVASFVLSIGIVVGLVTLSKDLREQPGSFLRQYPTHPVLESKEIKLADNNYYFAGATKDNIYLANTLRPLDLLEIKSDMSDTAMVHLKIDGIEGTRYVRISVAIDSPYFYVMDGAIPYVYRGNIRDWIGTPFLKDSTYFIDAVPISPKSFAIRALSTRTNENALGKMGVNSKSVKLNHELLQRQFDGVFDVDGSLTYNKDMQKLVFVYYYRNQYIVMDTNLNLDYRGNTIDTFKTAKVKTAEVHSEKAIHLSAPPMITNKSHVTHKEWLFVHSLLPAKNEYMENFNKASIVDVYNLSSHSYQFSFYVFERNGEKMRSFIVINKKLYGLFKHSIMSYDLIEKYFSNT